MGILDFLRPSEGRLTGSERRQYREHLAELDVLLEEGLESLGDDIARMTRSGDLDARSIWEQAARLDGIEEEISLVERGITERIPREQLAELARQQADTEGRQADTGTSRGLDAEGRQQQGDDGEAEDDRREA